MTYLLQSKKNWPKKYAPLIVVGVFIFIVVVITFISPSFLGRVSNSIGLPFWHSGGFLFDKVSDLKAFTSSRFILLETNKSLQAQLTETQIRLLAFSVIEKENSDLKKAWGRSGESKDGSEDGSEDGGKNEVNSILAYVLVKPPQSFYDTLILDVGQDKNINKGSKIIVANTVVLGTIDEVFGKTSRAKLFSSADLETLATIDRNSLPVTLIGKGAGNFEIQVPQEVDIVFGDTIILSGIKQEIVATVFEIESIPSNSFKRVFCKVPVNIDELRFVSIAD